jgi:hypothetical protein
MTITNNLAVFAGISNTLTSVGSNGQVLTSNGSAASWVSPAAGGQYQYVLYLSGTNTWTAPSNVTSVRVTVVGGGGGGATNNGACLTGGYGGTGGVAIGYYTVTPGSGYTVTVGAGGSGGASGVHAGSAGGTSSFGSLVSATGGGGGLTNGTGGSNGTGSSGNLRNGSILNGVYPYFVGPTNTNQSGSTSALTYSIGSNIIPGGNGQGVNTGNAAGGMGGIILIEYIG